jgi:ATP-dependent DNA helicase RecG
MDIATKRGKSKPSIERYLRTAKEVGIIEFKGAPKTGGYFLTEKMKAKLI